MDANVPLDEDDIAWLNSDAAEVHEAFGAEFRAAGDRFAGGKLVLKRIASLFQRPR